MNRDPHLSIVIPAHNAERFISRTIESALGQTFGSFELIVVDDASTDNTLGVAQEYPARDPRVRVLPLKQNARVSAARNHGISALHPASQAVLFLDHDDVLESDAVEQLLAVLEHYPSCAAAYGLARYIDAQGQDIWPGAAENSGRDRWRLVPGGVQQCAVEDPTTFEVLVLFNCIFTPGQALIRRKAMERTGEFDPSLMFCSDWDYWLRLCIQGELRLLDRVVLEYRIHGSSMSNLHQAKRDVAALLRKFGQASGLTTEQRAMMRQGHQWSCRVSSRHWLRLAADSALEGRFLRAMNQVRRAVFDQMRFHLRGWRGYAAFE